MIDYIIILAIAASLITIFCCRKKKKTDACQKECEGCPLSDGCHGKENNSR